MRKLIVILAFLFLPGCFSLNITKVSLLPPETTETFTYFPSGQVLEKSVGDQLINYNLKLKVESYQGYIVTEDFQPPDWMAAKFPLIVKGSEWIIFAKLETGEQLCKSAQKPYRQITSFGGTDYEACIVIKDSAPIGMAYCNKDIEAFGTMPLLWEKKAPAFLRPQKVIEKKEKSWREAEIFYVGKSKDIIRLLYRETLLKDMEFTFDLSESKTVAIKNIVIEIIEATNTSIKYIIRTTPDELKEKIRARENNESKTEF